MLNIIIILGLVKAKVFFDILKSYFIDFNKVFLDTTSDVRHF